MKKVLIIYLVISFIPNFIKAQSTLVNYGSTWAYYDQEMEPPNQSNLDWNDINYNEDTWNNGNTHMGYGDNDEVTEVNSSTLTLYTRKSFLISDPSIFGNLIIDLVYDDGAVVYLNGLEVARVNMPDGSINYGTFASSTSSDNSQISINIANSLVIGSNVIAVEIHQRSASSSDISFDLQLGATIPGAVDVTRGPYLQKATPSSVVIRWRTSVPTESVINYGTSISSLNQTVNQNSIVTDHEIEISGLNAGTTYFYQLANDTMVLYPPGVDIYFKTSPIAGTKPEMTIWILGDCGTASTNQRKVRDAYYNYIGENHTDMILFLGDNAYEDGTDLEYQSALFENMYEHKLKNTVSYSCLGNHDGHSANSNSQTGPYYDIFTFPKMGEAGGTPSGTEAYYSFDYGNVHFISLDSYETDRSAGGSMYNWCENDIQNTTAEWIVAFWHHPAYSKGSHDSDTESRLKEMRQNFVPMLESNGVDLVLSGHSHSYERSYFINGHYGLSSSFNSEVHTVGYNGKGDGKPEKGGAYMKFTSGANAQKGTAYITTGSSGKKSSGDLDHQAMYYSVSELGSCILEIKENRMDVKFIRENRFVEDYFTIFKDVQSCEALNAWVGDSTGDWHSDENNWSQGHFPLICEQVIIPSNTQITISADNKAYAYSLNLGSFSTLHVYSGGSIALTEQYDP